MYTFVCLFLFIFCFSFTSILGDICFTRNRRKTDTIIAKLTIKCSKNLSAPHPPGPFLYPNPFPPSWTSIGELHKRLVVGINRAPRHATSSWHGTPVVLDPPPPPPRSFTAIKSYKSVVFTTFFSVPFPLSLTRSLSLSLSLFVFCASNSRRRVVYSPVIRRSQKKKKRTINEIKIEMKKKNHKENKYNNVGIFY